MLTLPRTAVLLVVLLTVLPRSATAQQRDWDLTLGTRTWVTSGFSTRSFRAAGINPSSELDWRGVDSVVQEVSADLVWNRLVVSTSLGGGAIDQGVLLDSDFGATGHQDRFSFTRSAVGDDALFYASLDVGVRLLRWASMPMTASGALDVLVGYQHWQERYVGFGATGFPVTVPSGVRAISNEFFWDSLRVGARAQVPVAPRVTLTARGFVLPWSALDVEDVHALRGDLRQNPSFRDEAFGGLGVQAESGVLVTVWRGLGVEVGYRYWKIDSGEGDAFSFGRTATGRSILNNDSTERYGPYFSAQYRF